MKRIEFTSTAEEELVLVAGEIGTDDESVAVRFLDRVYEVLDKASETPRMGRSRPEYGTSEVIAYFVNRYKVTLVTALIKGDRKVVAVAHQRRKADYWAERLK